MCFSPCRIHPHGTYVTAMLFPLTGTWEIIFFMAPTWWYFLSHGIVLSVYAGDKCFLDYNSCFRTPSNFFSCLPSSVCQGLMVSENGSQVQAHNYLPWNGFMTSVYSTPPNYCLPSYLSWSGCVPNHLNTISDCAEQAFGRRLFK